MPHALLWPHGKLGTENNLPPQSDMRHQLFRIFAEALPWWIFQTLAAASQTMRWLG